MLLFVFPCAPFLSLPAHATGIPIPVINYLPLRHLLTVSPFSSPTRFTDTMRLFQPISVHEFLLLLHTLCSIMPTPIHRNWTSFLPHSSLYLSIQAIPPRTSKLHVIPPPNEGFTTGATCYYSPVVMLRYSSVVRSFLFEMGVRLWLGAGLFSSEFGRGFCSLDRAGWARFRRSRFEFRWAFVSCERGFFPTWAFVSRPIFGGASCQGGRFSAIAISDFRVWFCRWVCVQAGTAAGPDSAFKWPLHHRQAQSSRHPLLVFSARSFRAFRTPALDSQAVFWSRICRI